MKQESGGMNTESETTTVKKIVLNDIAFRLIAIPLCGIAIPLLTNMIDASAMSHGKLKLAYLFTIGIAWVIFHGNRYLHNTLRSYFDWFNKPYQKIVSMLIAIPFFTVPVSVILLVLWYKIFNHGLIEWTVIKQTTLLIMLAVVFIVHIYETVFLVKEAESEMVRRSEVERAKVQAELDALKNQIDPHFMFNSLNTLSNLIERHPEKAIQFNDHLADVYRYILSNKSRDLVLLGEELAFLEDYYALMKIRFGEALQFRIAIPIDLRDKYLVPPISLQIPAENAIKHNEFSEENPLELQLTWNANDTLTFSNPVTPKKQIRHSSGIGLENLDNRYKLITGKNIFIDKQTDQFKVLLPILPV
jgi:sensor histidine kinase YesM